MNESNTWETRRQKLIRILTDQKATLDLKSILKELEYSSKKALLNDIKHISKTLKNDGKVIKIQPPYCIACGFVFKQNIKTLKIPSKCPKCREQRISWPMIEIKK